MSVDARIADLVAQHGLSPAAPAAFATLLGLLAEDPTAPTTVTDPRAAVDAHLADSLTGLEFDAVRRARSVADLGAGAGFPGLPLAIALPDAQVRFVESAGRKIAFLDRALALLGIRNAETVYARAEEWQAGSGTCDLVTARALAPLTAIVEYAAPLLADGGALVAWKGRREHIEEADGAAAAAATGLELAEVRAVKPFPSAEHRHLYLYVKVGSTPNRFPRRSGMARKRPITAST